MREFDFNAAKAGKKVQLRSGQEARIISFDRKDPVKPIVVLVKEDDGLEYVHFYAPSGKRAADQPYLDLVMATEKKVGWVNIYTEPGGDRSAIGVYHTEPEAKEDAFKGEEKAVATVKIEWEE